MKIVKIALVFVIAIMAYILYNNIRKPIIFNEEKNIRYKEVIKKLKEIRTTQMAYKDMKGEFARSFDDLIAAVKNDRFMLVKIVGNPDDTTQIIRRDTFYIPVRDSLFSSSYNVDSLPYVPFGNGAKFSINAGEIERGKVKVKVFEVGASNEIILNGLDDKYYDKRKGLQVGSMTEPTYTGNFE